MEDIVVRREEWGLISVLTMEYRPYNLLGPTLIGAIAAELTAAQQAGSRAIVLRSGLRHFSAGADVAQFSARIEQGGRSQSAIGGVDFLKLLELLRSRSSPVCTASASAAGSNWRWPATISSRPVPPRSARSRSLSGCIRCSAVSSVRCSVLAQCAPKKFRC